MRTSCISIALMGFSLFAAERPKLELATPVGDLTGATATLEPTAPVTPSALHTNLPASSVRPLSPQELNDILAIASAYKLPTPVLNATIALATAKELKEEDLVEYMLLLESSGLPPSDLKAFSALKVIAPRLKSRFELLNPAIFSRLWTIKRQAMDMEKKGENTDELWKAYWDLFLKSCQSAPKTDK